MRILPLGVGDAFTARYYSSSVAVEHEGQWLLIDCPHPIRKMMREASEKAGVRLDVGDITALALTHLHADHSSGVEGFGYFCHFAVGHEARLLVHPEVEADLWHRHLHAGMHQLLPKADGTPVPKELHDFFEVTQLDETRAVRIGPFEIECRKTIHHIPTTALRIRAGGKTLGYSADTAFDPSLIQWLSASDLFIHETNFGVHTPYEKLAALPESTRKKMRLIHYPDEFDVGASVIPALRQGELLHLS